MYFSGVIPRTILLAALGAAMSACGGGGSSGSDDPEDKSNVGGNNGGGGSGLSGLSGLDGDADNQDLLYFSHTYQSGENPNTGQQQFHSALYALDPANPGALSVLKLDSRESALGLDMGRSHYAPLYEADVDDDGRVTNYRVSDVLFLHNRDAGNETSEGFARVSTDATTPVPAPVRVSSETYLGASVLGAGTLIWQDYADAENAGVVYGLPTSEKRVHMSFGATDEPQNAMSMVVRHVVALRKQGDPAKHAYLVLRTHEDLTCSNGYRLVEGNPSASPGPSAGKYSSVMVDNLLPSPKEVASAEPLGGPLSDNSQYLVIDTLINPNITGRPCVSEGPTLWHYKSSASPQLTQVLDANNQPLKLPIGVTGGPKLPSERNIAMNGDVLYFGVGGVAQTGPQDLYRVEGNRWSVLSEQEENLGYFTGFLLADEGRVAASAGNTVVSWDSNGNDRKELDTSNAASMGLQTDVLGSRDGWLFYNRTDIMGRDDAVAMKIDGSDSAVIADARWIGASLSGNGDNSPANVTELSEVFLWSGKDISAVSAADPGAGRVLLGTLDAMPEEVTMYGLAPGPHRLIQVHTDSDNSSVYYVNTRERDSLKKTLDAAGVQRPVTGF